MDFPKHIQYNTFIVNIKYNYKQYQNINVSCENQLTYNAQQRNN